jgi:hypothetical protein
VKDFAPGGGGSEKEFGELISGRWPGGGGRENEFGVLITGLWFMDMLDMEFPRFPMEDRLVFVIGVLLVDHGFDAGVLQFIEAEVAGT